MPRLAEPAARPGATASGKIFLPGRGIRKMDGRGESQGVFKAAESNFSIRPVE
ncbi:MAG: hypothetical protein OXC26_10585 [Albidovulum sp.]|nr:hypothetical protein [Albidovulum sp.]